MFINKIKDIIKPRVTSPPNNMFKPPYQTMTPREIALIISITGKKIEKCQMALIVAFLKPKLTCLKRSNSISSRLNTCMIFIPVMCSCTKVLSLDIADLSDSKALFIAV